MNIDSLSVKHVVDTVQIVKHVVDTVRIVSNAPEKIKLGTIFLTAIGSAIPAVITLIAGVFLLYKKTALDKTAEIEKRKHITKYQLIENVCNLFNLQKNHLHVFNISTMHVIKLRSFRQVVGLTNEQLRVRYNSPHLTFSVITENDVQEIREFAEKWDEKFYNSYQQLIFVEAKVQALISEIGDLFGDSIHTVLHGYFTALLKEFDDIKPLSDWEKLTPHEFDNQSRNLHLTIDVEIKKLCDEFLIAMKKVKSALS